MTPPEPRQWSHHILAYGMPTARIVWYPQRVGWFYTDPEHIDDFYTDTEGAR